MELMGLCSICGKPGAMFTCNICGRIVCSQHFNSIHGVCTHCMSGKQ